MHVNHAFNAFNVRQRNKADLLRTIYESDGSSSKRKPFGLDLSGCIWWLNDDSDADDVDDSTKGNNGKLDSSSLVIAINVDFDVVVDDEFDNDELWWLWLCKWWWWFKWWELCNVVVKFIISNVVNVRLASINQK